MIISDLHISDSMREVFATYERYRSALEVMAALEHQGRRHQILREVAALRLQYQAALDACGWADQRFWIGFSRLRLRQRKTLTGLAQVILRHALHGFSLFRVPYCLLRRVRQITATHPAIAPPSFA